MNKRQQQAQESKEKIFQAALALFEKYGYDQVTIEDICQSAGVSKGLFYNYFPSKMSLAWTAVQPLEEKYQQLAASFRPGQPATEKLCRFMRCMLESTFYDSTIQKHARLNYAREINGGTPLIFDQNRFAFRLLTQIVKEGQATGEFSSRLPADTLVQVVFRYGVGCCVYLFGVPAGEPLQTALEGALADFAQVLALLSA